MNVRKRKEKLNQIMGGWISYFKLADMKGLMGRTMDQWTRSCMRMVTWKCWKKVHTKP
nr:group II intron maturase-specific domain-containing protein [Caldifermentibacillus hisashii]